MRRLLAVALLLPIAGPAANFYVRSGATGSNNGSDWANAYTALPSTLSRGDTYYVASGNYGGKNFDTPAFGTQVITVKKATQTDHGTNAGWNSTYGVGSATFGNLAFRTPYWLFDGQYRNADWRGGHGFRIVSGLGLGSAGIDFGSGPLSSGWGGQNSTAHDITIRCTENVGEGLDNPNHDCAVRAVWGINNLTFSQCYFHDYGNVVILTDHNSGWLIEYSVLARNTSTAEYHAEGLAAQGDSNLTIRYNVWEDIEGTGFIVNLARDNNTYQADNWQIYGNIFMYTDGNPYFRRGVGNGVICCLDASGSREYATNWKIYNNLILNVPGYNSGLEFGASPEAGVPNNSNVMVLNNFWWKNPAPAYQTLGHCDNCLSDYNRFDQTLGGTGAHSQTNAVASTNIFVNYSARNFRLTAATANGTNLPAPFNVDMDGTTRGSGGVWDMGAFDR